MSIRERHARAFRIGTGRARLLDITWPSGVVQTLRDVVDGSITGAVNCWGRVAMVTTAGSYQSASDMRVHFGLRQDTRARLLRLRDVAAERILEVKDPQR